MTSAPALSRVSTNIHIDLYLPYDEEEGPPDKILDATVNNNEFLMRENQLFASFIHRHSSQVSSALEEEEGQSSSDKRTGSRQKSSILTMEQKLEVANRELEDTKEDKDKVEATSQSILGRIHALISEANLCASDERKSLFMFKKEVLHYREGDQNSHEVSAEKLLSFYQAKFKERQGLVAKLKMKNSGLKSRINRAKKRLSSKESLGEGLRDIDYEQLKIENRQFVHRLDEYNQDLMRLKVITGRIVAEYNDLKTQLAEISSHTTILSQDSVNKQEVLNRVATDINLVVKDRDKEDQTAQILKVRTLNGVGPTTSQYIDQKREESRLLKEVANLERKLEIARIRK
ncbi:hypothetical protein P9112_004246 [Eukaryota sp. TZLM1-RC]